VIQPPICEPNRNHKWRLNQSQTFFKIRPILIVNLDDIFISNPRTRRV